MPHQAHPVTSDAGTSAPPAPPVSAAPIPQHTRLGSWLSWLALGVAVLSLMLAWLLWQRLGKTQEEMARRSTDALTEVAAARTLADQAGSLTQDLQSRLSVAEARLSEVSLQRSQLEELMLSVSRSRDDSLVQDLESAVRLALQQSQLTGSAQPLISSLQAADQRIERAAQPRLNPVQRAIGRDIERIRAASLVDVPALASRIDELVRNVDEWPLQNAVGPMARGAQHKATAAKASASKQAKAEAGATRSSDASAWAQTWGHFQSWGQQSLQRWWVDLLEGSSELVRVSRVDRPEAALLAPDQAFFLRENIKLQLLNARLGLLARQLDTARADLRSANTLLVRYFDTQQASVQLAQAAIKQLQDDLRQDQLPRPDETLTALAAAASGR